MKRHKTNYPGVFYREVNRIGGKGLERVYYIVFKQGGKVFEEKVGRQYSDDMTPVRAARIRAQRIEGKQQSRKEIREAAAVVKWTVGRLWQEYNTGWQTDGGRYANHLKA
ncbi:MAG: site-specific integrase, partial [Proteobacteria bacterium]|nr:site-specific integrase [Pseudomonadota bacterium]